jgi:hypothetical protein
MDDLDAAIDGLTQKPMEEDDPIGAAVDNVINMDKARTGGAIRSAITVNPDQAAQAKAIASRAGLPQDVVLRNLPEMQAKDTAARIDAVSQRSEVLSRMFRERPDFGPVVHDDVDNLSGVEQALRALRSAPAAIASAAPRASAGLYGAAAAPFEVFGQVFRAAEDAIAGMLGAPRSMGSNVGEMVGSVLRGAQQSTQGVSEAMYTPPADAGILERGFGSGLQSAAQTLLTLPVAVREGGANAVLAIMGAISGGSAYGQARDAGLSPAQSAVFGVEQGVAEAVTERLPLGKLLGDIEANTGAGRMLVNNLLREIPGELAATTWQSFNEWLTLSPDKTIADWADALPDELVQTIVATVVGGGVQTGAIKGMQAAMGRISGEDRKARQAQEDAKHMEGLNKLAEASKVRQRSPEDWQAFMQAVSEDGPVKDVYIDARDLDEAALQKLVEASPAAAQQAAESLASGVDMQIPVAEFGSSVAGQGFAQSIIPHLKTDPNGMSVTQADEYLKTAKGDTERTVTETLGRAGQDDAFAASRAAVEADVLRQLNETGRFTEAVNKPNAALWAARYATLGSRLGITPEEAYKRYPATVTATPPTGEAMAQVSPDQAMGTNVPVDLPTDPAFVEAVQNTPGAQATPDGLLIDLVRFQKPEQEGAQAIRTGVFYLPAKSANVKHYKATPTTAYPNPYGGTEKMEGKTLLRRPLFVKGATGGKAPEAAYDAIKGKGAMKSLDRSVMDVVTSKGVLTREDPALFEENVQRLLRENGGEPGLAGEIIQNSKQGNTLRYALQEHIIAHAVRAAGYDAVLGYSKGKSGAFVSEVFDVREQTYPSNVLEAQIHSAFLQADLPPSQAQADIDGNPVIQSAEVEIAYAQPTERLELIPVEGQQLYNMAIMSPSNEYLGYVELLYENGKLTGLYDIEIEKDGRRDGVGAKVIEAILAANPREKILISNVVPAARGFWAKVGVPEQNVGEGDAYDGYLDWNTYAASETGKKRGAKALGSEGQGGAGAAGVQGGPGAEAGGFAQGGRSVDQTETPEFKKWFDDSKVVDADGKPLVVYHGTQADFVAFDPDRAGQNFPDQEDEVGMLFSDAPNEPNIMAERGDGGGGNVMPVYLALQDPFIVEVPFKESVRRFGVASATTWYDNNKADIVSSAKRGDHDGIIIKSVAPDGYRTATFVAFEPEQIKSAIGNRGTFDPNDPNILRQQQSPVGATGPQRPAVRGLFTPASSNIALLEQANLTTFVHESGHLFLDQTAAIAALDDAPADIKADMQTLLDWFGIKAEEGASQLQVWQRMTIDQQREHHEKFARGFEAFAFEGKAPSTALAGAFQRFRGWLRNWYRSLAGLNVQLTDEVRAVMSRMVATDVEIEQARSAQSMGLMFDQAAAEKLGIDYRAYQEQDRDASDEAATELDQRRLNDLKWFDNAKSAALRARQREVADIRRGVKAEARSMVMAQPVYRAWSFLTGKSGDAVVPGVTAVDDIDTAERTGKLRTSVLNEMMGDAPDASWRKLVGLRMTNDTTGMHPDIVAELFGYASGQELVAALVNAPLPQLAIDAQTDSLMLQRYGDITSPQEMERAAIEAVHNQARAKVIATELNALEKAAKTSKKTVTAAAKTFAAQVVGRQKVGDLKPEKFEAAARKAGQASLKAFKAGDIQKAATEKRNELINTYAARIARDAKAEIDKKVKTYTKAANKPIADVAKTRDADTVQAMRAILAEYGIGRRGEPAQKYIDALKTHDPDTHARLSASIDTLTANAKDYKALSVEDFQALADDIDVMWKMSRRSRQMEIDGDMIDAQEAQEAVRAQIEKEGVPDRIAGEGRAVTEGEKTTAILRSARAALRRVESWVYARDGGPQGAFRKYVFNPIKVGADNYRAAQATYRKRYLDLLSTLNLKGGRIDAPELGYVFGYSNGGSGKQEILHAILHTGNDSNKRKLLLGMEKMRQNPQTGKLEKTGETWGKKNADNTVDSSDWDAFLRRMIDTGVITKADYDLAQGVWDLLEETKAGAQQTHRQVFGRSFDEVTANSFVTPFGTYRGGYVPAMADPDAVSDAKTRAILEEENQTMAQAFPSTAKGFTKGRTEYNKALLLDLRSLAGHLDKVLMFTHLEAPVRDVRRLLGHDSVRVPLSRMDPSAYDGMLIPWLNRSARQQTETPVPAYNGVMKWLSKARSRAGMSSMIGNVVNAAQQVTGFAVAAIRVKPRYLRSALVEYVQNPRKTTDRVAEASQYMESRMRSEVAQMNLAIDEILLNPNVYKKAQAWTARHGYFLQSAVDNVMGPIIWTGAYNEAIEQGASELDARRQADSAIRETQGSSLPEDIAAFEAGNSFTRLFTQFQGYFNMQANLLGTEFAKTQREMGLRAGMGRGLYVFTLGFLVPALVAQLIAEMGRGGVEDEDGDGYLDDWLASLGIGTAKSAFALVPGAGQAGVLVFNAANDKPYDDRASLSPAVSMVEAAARSPFSVYAAVTGEGSARKAVRDVGSLISLTTGLPGGAVARPLGYAADLATERIEPTGPADLVRGLVTGNPSAESKR